MAAKLDGYLRAYRGDTNDLAAFWKKYEVVARLNQWTSAEQEAANLPLFLDGEAFIVYSELSEYDQKDPAVIKRKLTDAFGIPPA